jgi:hypothetical protein
MKEPRYSGKNRSGICKCGHSWEDHHLGMVMQQQYIEQTHEGYIPQECEAFGFNETGGMKYDEIKEEWVDHCQYYSDTKENNLEIL